MNILVVSQYFWPESFQINDVVKSLSKREVTVDVLTGKPNYPEGKIFPGFTTMGVSEEKWGNTTIYRVPLIARGDKSAFRLVANYFSFVLFGVLLSPWLLRKNSYEVILVFGMSPILQAIPALFIGKIKRIPVVIWIQDLWPESLEATGYIKNRFVLSLVGKVVKYIYRHSDLLLTQSQAFIEPVSKMAPGVNISYFPNSVDDKFFNPAKGTLPEIAALEEGFTVLFAGNVGAGQAVEVIVDAAILLQDYPEIQLVVLGKGSRWDWMNREAENLSLENLHLPGEYPVETMPGLMRKASALLVSLSDQPIFALTVPNKIQAYLAVGRPIIACLNGEGARVVEESGAGLSVPAENGKALAAAILKIYNMSSSDREKIGENGRRYYKENYDNRMLVGQLLNHFTEVINCKS